jgi:hypothetical protein
MLWIDDRLFTWADVTLRQELPRIFCPSLCHLGNHRLALARTGRSDAERPGSCALSHRESRQTLSARLAVLVRLFR